MSADTSSSVGSEPNAALQALGTIICITHLSP